MKLLYILPIALILSGCSVETTTDQTEPAPVVEDLSPDFRIAEEVQVNQYLGTVTTPTYITNVGTRTEEIYSVMINRNENCMVYAWKAGRELMLNEPGATFLGEPHGEYFNHAILNVGDGIRVDVPDGCGREIVVLDIVTSNGYYTFDDL